MQGPRDASSSLLSSWLDALRQLDPARLSAASSIVLAQLLAHGAATRNAALIAHVVATTTRAADRCPRWLSRRGAATSLSVVPRGGPGVATALSHELWARGLTMLGAEVDQRAHADALLCRWAATQLDWSVASVDVTHALLSRGFDAGGSTSVRASELARRGQSWHAALRLVAAARAQGTVPHCSAATGLCIALEAASCTSSSSSSSSWETALQLYASSSGEWRTPEVRANAAAIARSVPGCLRALAEQSVARRAVEARLEQLASAASAERSRSSRGGDKGGGEVIVVDSNVALLVALLRSLRFRGATVAHSDFVTFASRSCVVLPPRVRSEVAAWIRRADRARAASVQQLLVHAQDAMASRDELRERLERVATEHGWITLSEADELHAVASASAVASPPPPPPPVRGKAHREFAGDAFDNASNDRIVLACAQLLAREWQPSRATTVATLDGDLRAAAARAGLRVWPPA
jgi:hypothetical protein